MYDLEPQISCICVDGPVDVYLIRQIPEGDHNVPLHVKDGSLTREDAVEGDTIGLDQVMLIRPRLHLLRLLVALM